MLFAGFVKRTSETLVQHLPIEITAKCKEQDYDDRKQTKTLPQLRRGGGQNQLGYHYNFDISMKRCTGRPKCHTMGVEEHIKTKS